MSEPLGNHPTFRHWDTAREFSNGHVTFGATVIPHLVEGIGEFLATTGPRTFRQFQSRVAVGVVPWLTHPEIVRRLSRMDATCITIDKGAHELSGARELQATAKPIPASWIGFEEYGPVDENGQAPIIGPSSPMPGEEIALGPVRMAGYQSGHAKPLVHAKVLVLCHVDSVEYGEVWDGNYLKPVTAWLGSANWTQTAPDHLEFGLWTRDTDLVRACLEFVIDVLRFSEPLEPGTQIPKPELVAAEYDEVAISEYIQDREPDDLD